MFALQLPSKTQLKPTSEIAKPPKAPLYQGEARNTGETAAATAQSTAACTPHDKRYAIKRFADYRWDGDSIEIKVEWEEGWPTWEPEVNLHSDAPDDLFVFWASQGGHPTNPSDASLYEVHSITSHSPNRKKLLVSWAGFADATWEPCAALETWVGDAVADYWRNVQTESKKNERRAQKIRRRQKKLTY